MISQQRRFDIPVLAIACEALEPRTLFATDLPALADAYVRDGASADRNFGSDSVLLVKETTIDGYTRESYLRFDIGSTTLAAGQTVKLRLFGRLSDAQNVSVAVDVLPVSNTTWSESAITWNNQPAPAGAAALDRETISGTSGTWYEWDVTEYVIDEKTNGQTQVTFLLRGAATTVSQAMFSAEEASGNDPVLVVSDAAPPPGEGQAPYHGSAFAVGGSPVTIQAEDFDRGGEGIAYHDTSTSNTGNAYRPDEAVDIMSLGSGQYRIGGPYPGEWLEYTVDVQQPGTYELAFRVSQTDAGSTFHAEIDGTNVTGTLSAPDTGSFNTFTSVAKSVALTAGTHVLRFAHDGSAANGYGAGLDWIRISPLAQPPPPVGSTTVIPITDATYVRGGAHASANYATETALLVKRSADATYQRETFLQFDMSQIADISGATLRLYGGLSDSVSGGIRVDVFLAEDNWEETSLTYNSRPATNPSAMASATISSTAPGWHEFDLTRLLQAEKSSGRNLVSLALRAATITTPYVAFNADSASSNRPEVVITSSGAGRPVNVGVALENPVQTMEGFGSGMIAWIPRDPNTPDRFEYQDPAFYDQIVGDLGATMARVPIWPTFEPVNDNDDPNTFNWSGFDSAALGRSLTFLQRLKDRGVTRFMATVWTPPQWMKTSGAAYDGGMLRPDRREEFAEYIAAFALVARDQFGIQMAGISLQNEPLFVTSYESMIVTPEQLRELIRTVRRKLDREGLAEVKILMPEDVISSNRYDWYVEPTLADAETRAAVGALIAHGTQTDHWNTMGPLIDGYREEYGKPFWLTEASGHATSWAGAMTLATHMYDAVVRGDASAYLYWQWTDYPGSTFSFMIDGEPTAKYHAAKHFYRYIRPGAIRVGATSSDSGLKVASFRHPGSGAVTHVLINTATTAADVTLNLSGAGAAGGYRQYRTSATENHVRLGDVAGGSTVRVTLPGSSIVTLYSGEELSIPSATSGGPLPAVQRIDVGPMSAHDAANSSALRSAVMKGQLSTVRTLISQGADVNEASLAGWTPLHVAAASPYGNAPAIIAELLGAGAQLDRVTLDGWNPLHVAAANGTTANGTSSSLAADKVNALLAGSGASSLINARDADRRTPLHWAGYVTKLNLSARTEDATVVNALLNGGADKTLLDDFGKTARDYALAEGNAAAASALA